MKNLRSVFIVLAVVLIAAPVFAADKKFSYCMSYGDVATISFGGLTIEARCEDGNYAPEIFYSSETPNTMTTYGFWPNPANDQFFWGVWTDNRGTCHHSIDSGAMISEKGEYLGIDGETLILCREVMECDCTVSAVVVKQKMKMKVPKPPKIK